MERGKNWTRRRLLTGAVAAGGGAIVAAIIPRQALAAEEGKEKGKPADVTPAEDLMFEHGLLGRLLLIYAAAAGRIQAGGEAPTAVIIEAANLARSFNENYHAKLEEEEIFPRFRKAGRLVELVTTLKDQHDAGRRVTDVVLQLTRGGKVGDALPLAAQLRAYERMYHPHVAQENSVLFRSFQRMLPAAEYQELGDRFEDREHKVLGENGFEKAAEQITALERQLGIEDLKQFTPKA